jgi:hypothetical protein
MNPIELKDLNDLLYKIGYEFEDLLSIARVRPPQDPYSEYLYDDGSDQDAIIIALKDGRKKGLIIGIREADFTSYEKDKFPEGHIAASITMESFEFEFDPRKAKSVSKKEIEKYVKSLESESVSQIREKDEWTLLYDKGIEAINEFHKIEENPEEKKGLFRWGKKKDEDREPLTYQPFDGPFVSEPKKGMWTILEWDQRVYLSYDRKIAPLEINDEYMTVYKEFVQFLEDETKHEKIGNLIYYKYDGRTSYPDPRPVDPEGIPLPAAEPEDMKYVKGRYTLQIDKDRKSFGVVGPYSKYVRFDALDGLVDIGRLVITKKENIYDRENYKYLDEFNDELLVINQEFEEGEGDQLDEEYVEEQPEQPFQEAILEDPILEDPIKTQSEIKEIEKANEEYVKEKGNENYSYLIEPKEKFTDVGFWLYMKHQRGSGGAIRLYRSAIGQPMAPASFGGGAIVSELAVPLNHFTQNWTKGLTPTGEGPGAAGEKSLQWMYYNDQRLLALTFIHKLWQTWQRTKTEVERDFKSGSNVKGGFDSQFKAKNYKDELITYGYIYDETEAALKILSGKIDPLITTQVLGQFYMVENGLNVSDGIWKEKYNKKTKKNEYIKATFDSMLQIQGVDHPKGPMTGKLLYDTGNSTFKVGKTYKARDFLQSKNKSAGSGYSERYVYFVKSLLVWYLPRFDQDFKSFKRDSKFPYTDTIPPHPKQQGT